MSRDCQQISCIYSTSGGVYEQYGYAVFKCDINQEWAIIKCHCKSGYVPDWPNFTGYTDQVEVMSCKPASIPRWYEDPKIRNTVIGVVVAIIVILLIYLIITLGGS